MSLADYGYTDRFRVYENQYPEYIPARVISQERGLYTVVCDRGELSAEISGRLRYTADNAVSFSAAGDFVMLSLPGGEGRAVIHSILPRKSTFVRRAAGSACEGQVIAANVDTVFICTSLNGDFNIRRLERYTAAVWDSGAFPVTVLTKADLCSNASEKLTEIERALPGTETVLTSAFNYDTAGLDKYLQKGKTIAFAGSSGTGKSTLINLLLGEDRFDTAGIDKNDRGRHTTTSRQLVRLPQGAMLIDTPGMRELGMWHQAEGIEKTFSDIRELMGQCRFSDCSHTNEPGCAIKSAIASGELSKERWEAYLKLESENAYSQDTDSYLAQKEKKFKEIAKINRRR